MWISAEHPSFKCVRGDKLDTIYTSRIGSGNWKVVGTMGDRDYCLVSGISDESSAEKIANDIKDRIDVEG